MIELQSKVLVLPACCFAPIQWYALMLSAEKVLIDTHENYPKQTYRNRFEICNSHGRQCLTIPVEGQKGLKVPMKDIRIADDRWRKLYPAALRSAYGKSAFYIHLEEDLHRLFEDVSIRYLIDFNRMAFRILLPFFPGLAWTESNEYVKNEGNLRDGRDLWEPSQKRNPLPSYPQVFSDRLAFVDHLSILDLVMNLGPGALDYILLLKNDSTHV